MEVRNQTAYFGFEFISSISQSNENAGLFAALFIIVFAVGLLTNGLFLTIMLQQWKRLDLTDKLMFNLAIGDVISIIPLPFAGFLNQIGHTDVLKTNGCQLFAWLSITVMMLTCTNGVAMSFDLYYRVIHPQLRELDAKYERIIIGVTWVIASFPGLALISHVKSNNQRCFMTWNTHSEIVFVAVMFFIHILIPMAIITFILVRMGVALQYETQTSTQGDLQRDDVTLVSDTSCNHDNTKRALAILVLNAFYYTIVTLYFFVHLWFILNLSHVATSSRSSPVYTSFAIVLSCKCFINPFIYAIFLDKFKDRLKEFCFNRKSGTSHRFLLKYRKARSDTVTPISVNDYIDRENSNQIIANNVDEDIEVAYRDTVAILH